MKETTLLHLVKAVGSPLRTLKPLHAIDTDMHLKGGCSLEWVVKERERSEE